MAVDRYVLRISPDGTPTALPSPLVITPGVDTIWECEATAANGADIGPVDLTAARLVWELTALSFSIAMWIEDAPFFLITDGPNGLFSINLAAGTTSFLVDGTYQLEVKAVTSDGRRRRIIWMPSLLVLLAPLATQP